MSLLTDGTDYFLQPADGSSVEMSYGGAPVVAGEFASTAPGPRSARRRRRTDTKWPCRSRAPTSIRFGIPTAAAMRSRSHSRCRVSRWSRMRPVSARPERRRHDRCSAVRCPDGDRGLWIDDLASGGSNYLLQPNGGPAVELSYGGTPVTAGQFGGWTPIGAEQTASGYQVAWRWPSADQYNHLVSPTTAAIFSQRRQLGVGVEHAIGVV